MINLNLNKVFVKLLFFFLHYIVFSFSDRSICLYLTWNLKKGRLVKPGWNYWRKLGTALGNPLVPQPERPHFRRISHSSSPLTRSEKDSRYFFSLFFKSSEHSKFCCGKQCGIVWIVKTCGQSRVDLLAHEKRGPDCLNPNGANANLNMTCSHAILLCLGTPNPATSFNNGVSYHMG